MRIDTKDDLNRRVDPDALMADPHYDMAALAAMLTDGGSLTELYAAYAPEMLTALAPMGGRVALVMGSEGSGVSRLVMEHCDFACRLPQRGRVESLNVAQAATVMCYEWLRRESAQKNPGGEER